MAFLTLTINGFPVDLPPDAEVALSYRANDLRTLQSREAAFSETFTLPLTAQNVAVLGTPHALDSLTTTPYRLLPARLTSPGGQDLLIGYAVLDLCHDGYDVTLTNALGGLFVSVGERTLHDLDLSPYDHTYSLAACALAENNNYAQGYAYALADDGRITLRDPAVGVLFYETRLAVFYHAVLSAIVAQAVRNANGLPPPVGQRTQVTGTLLAEDTYRRAVLPQAPCYPQVGTALLARSQASGVLVLPRFFDSGTSAFNPVALQFPMPTDPGGNFFAGTYFSPPPYRADVTVRVSLRLQLALTPGAPSGGCSAQVYLRDANKGTGLAPAGQLGVIDRRDAYAGPTANLTRGPFTMDYTVLLPALAPGASLCLQVTGGGIDVTALAGSSITFEVGGRVYPGGPVQLSAALPVMKQADFLTLLCNQFNVIVTPDPAAHAVRFDLFNDLERNRPRAVDWSAKIDWQRRPRLAFRLGTYAQRNTLTYAAPPKDYAALGLPLTTATARADLAVYDATLPARADAYAAPVWLPMSHAALGAAGTGLLWLPFVTEGPDFKFRPEPWNPARTYGDTGQPVLYGGLAWTGAALVAGTVPGVVPPSGGGGAWVVLPYTSLNDTLDTVALLTPALGTGTGPALLVTTVRDDNPSPATYGATRRFDRTGFDFTALTGAYYAGLQSLLGRVQVLTLDLRLNATDLAALDFTVPVRFQVPAANGFGELDCLAYLNLIDQYVAGRPGAVACTLIVLGLPVPALAPPMPLPPIARLRRALADELGTLFTTETGQYILLEA